MEADTRKAFDVMMGALKQVLDNQEAQKEAFEEFREEILEKLDNISTPGVDFGYEGT